MISYHDTLSDKTFIPVEKRFKRLLNISISEEMGFEPMIHHKVYVGVANQCL